MQASLVVRRNLIDFGNSPSAADAKQAWRDDLGMGQTERGFSVNWDAISAIAETVGTIAVVITLIYLAVQLRIGNKQRELETLRHNWDGLNGLAEFLSESTERASLVNRGREELQSLTDDEALVFLYLHIRILNTIEVWYMQLIETSPPGEYRNQQQENIVGVIEHFFSHPGALEIWNDVKHMFVPIHELFDAANPVTETDRNP